MRSHGSFPWADLGWGGGALLALVLGFVKRVRNFFRNLWRDWVFQRGTKGIDGLTETVDPARMRMKTLERISKTNTEAIGVIQETMVTKEDHAELAAAVGRLDEGQLEILKKLTRNGGDTDDAGDVLWRIAGALGVADPDAAKEQRRRSSDRGQRPFKGGHL